MLKVHSHRGTTVSGRVAHDNTLRYASNAIRFTIRRRIEQMIGRLLEGRQHEHAVLHFGYAKTGDAQNFALSRE